MLWRNVRNGNLWLSAKISRYYQLIFFADENCWTAVPDTQSLGSQRHPATNVTACQEACWNNNSCNGVDWDPRQQIGHRCWLIGPWTRVRQAPRQGITQYLVDRTHCGKLVYDTMRNHNVERATRLLEDSHQRNIPHRYSIVSRMRSVFKRFQDWLSVSHLKHFRIITTLAWRVDQKVTT